MIIMIIIIVVITVHVHNKQTIVIVTCVLRWTTGRRATAKSSRASFGRRERRLTWRRPEPAPWRQNKTK